MNADEYQQKAARTLIAVPDFQIRSDEVMIVWNSTGVAGEAANIEKLDRRYPEGYSAAASQARADKAPAPEGHEI